MSLPRDIRYTLHLIAFGEARYEEHYKADLSRVDEKSEIHRHSELSAGYQVNLLTQVNFFCNNELIEGSLKS